MRGPSTTETNPWYEVASLLLAVRLSQMPVGKVQVMLPIQFGDVMLALPNVVSNPALDRLVQSRHFFCLQSIRSQ